MKYILLLILLFSIETKAFAQALQGVWKLETSSSLQATSMPLKKEITLKIFNEDSVGWELHEEQVIGFLADEKGNYAGLEKSSITEKGSGKVFKGLTEDYSILRLNILYTSFHREDRLIKEYNLKIHNRTLLLEALDSEEVIELKRTNYKGY